MAMRSLLLLSALMTTPALAQSTATVATSGANSRVTVDQSASDRSAVTIDQIGAGDGVTATQSGTGATLDLVARGNDQQHQIAQNSAGAASVSVNAFGDRDTSSILQTVAAGGVGEITLLQNGSDNRAELTQQTEAASTNRLLLTQLGDGNLARLSQQGADNVLDLTQAGNNLVANVTQRGSGLNFSMTQTGANTPITVVQTR